MRIAGVSPELEGIKISVRQDARIYSFSTQTVQQSLMREVVVQ